MAITKTWEINTMEREVSDGYVTKVIYRVKGISDSEEKARETGEVNFPTGQFKPDPLPSDFVDFSKLDAATVLGWVKTALGDEVATIETRLEAKVNEVLTPTTAAGVPWS
tara:strand:- start:25 stop:354 length:330 start_codon:yes stop_codon:yes gene_type:complete